MLQNAIVGDIPLTGDALELPGDGLVLIAYTPQANSPAADQLALLASWAANHTQPTETADTVPPTAENKRTR